MIRPLRPGTSWYVCLRVVSWRCGCPLCPSFFRRLCPVALPHSVPVFLPGLLLPEQARQNPAAPMPQRAAVRVLPARVLCGAAPARQEIREPRMPQRRRFPPQESAGGCPWNLWNLWKLWKLGRLRNPGCLRSSKKQALPPRWSRRRTPRPERHTIPVPEQISACLFWPWPPRSLPRAQEW